MMPSFILLAFTLKEKMGTRKKPMMASTESSFF